MNEERRNRPANATPLHVPTRRHCPACGLEVEGMVANCPQDGTNLVNGLEDEPAFKDKYEFLGTIGAGGMGVIYKARQIALDKVIAIKMLHPHIVSKEAFRRFQIEAKAASLLQHPFIINVQDLATTDSGQPYMVMDFVAGRTLAQVIEQNGPLSTARFLRIFEQVCGALAHAHSRGVIHRDLKPSNIMLTRNDGQEEVRIMDFGIAKLIDAADEGAGQLTRTGETIGSPQYMSPEQARGAKTDVRSDLYSLGCVMYEALTGVPPFSGSTAIETMIMHMNDKPVSMTQSLLGKVEFNPDLETMIARLLEKNPDLRYQSMEELRSAILRLQSGKALDRFTDTAPVRRFGWQQICIAAALGACVMGALLVVAYFALKKSTPEVRVTVDTTTRKKLSIEDLVRLRGDSINLSADGALAVDDEINNNSIAPLENATNAIKIDLGDGKIDDRGLEHISQLKLVKLNLTGTDVRDLHALKDMTTLEYLFLEQTALDSKGMKVIGRLGNLHELNIDKTGVSDADLESLAGLQHLQLLHVRNCSHLTKDGVERWHTKNPFCMLDSSFSLSPLPPTLMRANDLKAKKHFIEAADLYAEEVQTLKHRTPPDLWLIAACLTGQAECYGADGVIKLTTNPAIARQSLAKARSTFQLAINALDEIPLTNAENKARKTKSMLQIYLGLAMALEAARDWQNAEAIRLKMRALPVDSDYVHTMIDNAIKLGADYFQQKDYKDAEKFYQEADSLYAKLGETDTLECSLPVNALGDVYCTQQLWEKALTQYERGISILKKHPEIWTSKICDGLRWTTALCNFRLGRDAKAEALLKEFLQHQPDNTIALDLMKQLLTKEHRTDEAAHYEQLLRKAK